MTSNTEKKEKGHSDITFISKNKLWNILSEDFG